MEEFRNIIKSLTKACIIGSFLAGLFVFSLPETVHARYYWQQNINPPDSVQQDSSAVYTPSFQPTFQPKDRYGDPFTFSESPSPLLLDDPASLQLDVEIDTGMNYTIYETIGDINYRPTTSLSFDEFDSYLTKSLIKDYWKTRSTALDGESAVSGRDLVPKIYISPVFDRIFGGSYIEIQRNGFVTLDFGGRWQRIFNPSLNNRQQRNGGFEFDQQISMNVTGKIGEKMAVRANFDNNNSFDFENDLKVEYTGFEEDIIKKLEIGNVSLPLNNSLINGAQNLFGIKTQLQFGRLYVTTVLSSQRGRSETLSIDGGFQGREFQLRASQYDENRHFFLSHFFRDNYERWINVPNIISGVNVNRVEVYVFNRTGDTETLRSFAAFMDLGEEEEIFNPTVTPGSQANNNGRTDVPTDNDVNDLWASINANPNLRDEDRISDILENDPTFNFVKATDYELVTNARKLQEGTDYVVNRQLGYITLLRRLQNDEVLGVSYEYTFSGRPGQSFKVGELAEDYANRPQDDLFFMKLLRPSKIATDVPTWDLMMKNIYNLNAGNVNQEGFQLRVIYRDDASGVDNPSLHVGRNLNNIPLIRVMQLDQLNPNLDQAPDGNFDFVEGVTIDPTRGNIIFPVLEPFGEHLARQFEPSEEALAQRFVYDTLYRTTLNAASQITELDKFFITGSLQAGSSTEINLPGINIAENSVRVTAGGIPLSEGVDFRVDYNFGKVTILNQGILSSGKNIQITYEKADFFNFANRTLIGSRLDYKVSDDINLGATILRLNEQPLISRVSVGDEPTRNTKYGFDVSINKKSRLLTKMIDAIPIVNTKEESNITFNAEFAQIIPGTSNIVNGEGTSYIDDFEGTITPYNMMGNVQNNWKLAATPSTPDDRYDLTNLQGELGFTAKRAKISWYVIDNVFYRTGGPAAPNNLTDEDRDNHYTRAVGPQEVFPFRDQAVINTNETVFDIAYYPSERGQYNFNTEDMIPDGERIRLNDPEDNWAGITRAINSDVDFDKTNIEYIEFWMMDPFIDTENGRVLDGVENANNNTGGDLFFNLGSISEDVMPDNRHAFENGLPIDYDVSKVEINDWGRVTQAQFLTPAFSNSEDARVNQDVGLDGLRNEDEADFFFNDTQLSGPLGELLRRDGAGDNFSYFLGDDLDNQNVKILERYKDFNGMESNSPVATNNNLPFIPSATNIPDNEDLNADNTISDLEEYYEYRINLRPGELEVGRNFIVDQITNTGNRTSEPVNWYLFRIPIRQPDRVQGNINGFKTIKFMRMYMAGWRQPVVLRMVKFQLVGSQWREYETPEELAEGNIDEISEGSDVAFNISVVNIEENGQAAGTNNIPYVLPPGVFRDRDNTSTIERRRNEQSMRLDVVDLPDKASRAAYKNVDLNLINYGSMKMFIHAQAPEQDVEDGEVTAFLRLGTDRNQNYYEIEVPLEITPPGVSSGDVELIWPAANEIDIAFDELYALKGSRDRTNQPLNRRFRGVDSQSKYNLYVKGNPDLSSVQTMMIGLRNPSGGNDEDPKTVIAWFNELRVADFDRTKGWAANARLNTKLADVGTLSASTNYRSIGFGSIQQKIAERSLHEDFGYDISANLQVDKFLPAFLGLKVPMFVSYERTRSKPKFNPYNPDITLDETLLGIEDETERERFEDIAIAEIERRSLNFTNVRKVKTKEDAISLPWDIENFSFNYAFSEELRDDHTTESYIRRNYRGGIAYNYAPPERPIEPFKNVGFLKSDWLGLIRDFNFNLIPSNIAVRADLDRQFIRTQLWNDNLTTIGIEPQFEKFFNFRRTYNLRWNLTKSLSIDYDARANAVIDEPEGDLNTEEKRDSVINNLKNFGRLKNFDQNITATYRLPLDKFPVTSWIRADLRYSAGYSWTARAIEQQDTLGNTLQNNRDQSISTKFDMVALYNKVPFLKNINSPPRSARRGGRGGRSSRGQVQQQQDSTKTKAELKGLKGVLRLLMSVRSIDFNYSQREGTVLPGFNRTPQFFGMDDSWNAPGWDFILGSQNPDIRQEAADRDWLARSPFQSDFFTQSRTETINIRAQLEPVKDLRIQLDAKKTNTANYLESFIFLEDSAGFRSLSPSRSGQYNISFSAIRTAFTKENSDGTSPVFEQFIENRAIIAQRLNEQFGTDSLFGLNSQDVLIPAFAAAYSGKEASETDLTPFPKIPLPNWRVDYAGLSKIKALSEVFSSINITHGYSSSYDVSNFNNSLEYNDGLTVNNNITNYPIGTQTNDNGQVVPVYLLTQVTIREQFAPLVGVNVRTKSRITARAEYKQERNLTLNVGNFQVTEVQNNDVVLEFGLTKAGMKLPFRVDGRVITLKNDITFRMNLTIRDTKTTQRNIEEDDVITAGNTNFQLRPTVSYVLNDKLNIQVYFERSVSTPQVSNSFKNAVTAFGTQIRFSLSE